MGLKIKNCWWLCETPKEKKAVSFIFLIGSFLELCKNMRRSKNGGEFRIFISWVQLNLKNLNLHQFYKFITKKKTTTQ